MIPQTLADVASAALDGDSFGRNLANFLDGFYVAPSAKALEQRPPLLKGALEEGGVKDAYLAATAEELTRKYNLKAPVWIFEEERKLHSPWFGSELQSLRAILLVESPVGFRSRNLFVSANALSRA